MNAVSSFENVDLVSKHFRHFSFGQIPTNAENSEPQTLNKRPKRRIKILNKRFPEFNPQFNPPVEDLRSKLIIPSKLAQVKHSAAPSLMCISREGRSKLQSASSSVLSTAHQKQEVKENNFTQARDSILSA